MLLLPTDCDVHFFVDEFVVNGEDDLETIDDILAKIDKKNYAWITVAKANDNNRHCFEAWLEKKISEGYREPSLKYPLRNSKQILDFERSLASNSNTEKDLSLTTATANPNPNRQSSEPLVSANCMLLPYGLPRPTLDLKIPINLTCGDRVCIEVHDGTNELLVDAMKRCFKKLPAHRVLVVVLSEEISCDLISAVEEAREQRRPLIIDRKSQADGCSSTKITQIREYELFVRKWLVDLSMTQDLIASSCVIAGFEWASVLIITNDKHRSQFYARNMVMRAMSRLVWLKTNSIDEVNEQKQIRTSRLKSWVPVSNEQINPWRERGLVNQRRYQFEMRSQNNFQIDP